jgi:hypothetical protein
MTKHKEFELAVNAKDTQTAIRLVREGSVNWERGIWSVEDKCEYAPLYLLALDARWCGNLLDAGLDPNLAGHNGYTLLHMAVWLHRTRSPRRWLVKKLLAMGADPHETKDELSDFEDIMAEVNYELLFGKIS